MTEIDPGRALDVVREVALACRRCPLHETRTQVVFGHGDPAARLMLVGEAPGADEDLVGRPFVGDAGTNLHAAVEAAGLGSEPSYITNTVKCHPRANRRPEPEEVAACRPFLDLELLIVRPAVVVGLGQAAMNRLVDPALQTMSAYDGQPREVDGAWRLAAYHPSPLSLNTNPARRAALVDALRQARDLLASEDQHVARPSPLE